MLLIMTTALQCLLLLGLPMIAYDWALLAFEAAADAEAKASAA